MLAHAGLTARRGHRIRRLSLAARPRTRRPRALFIAHHMGDARRFQRLDQIRAIPRRPPAGWRAQAAHAWASRIRGVPDDRRYASASVVGPRPAVTVSRRLAKL